MITTIIFDFGDVFINLDKPATEKELKKLGLPSINKELSDFNKLYEIGKITTSDFIDHYQKIIPNTTKEQIVYAWNAILKEFPDKRLDFIKKLSIEKKYKLLLLSNTNELHINWIQENISFYHDFKSCFDSFYLSHEINLRKPDSDIFQYVLEEHKLAPENTLFIDDTEENTIAAQRLGIKTWNNNPVTEDITELFSIKSDLF
ncbi:HAD family phosphatase [uncultured Aquimarina sp.]|uniref:HAD family hydrolase n=1 Tax=uncultured Aquimarina sp. TaxID=575652 RepID=UPI00261A42FA|nr:HAD family phosphatase [uncultured Aquimarina sp.]